MAHLVQTLTMRAYSLILLAMLTHSACADEVRRLRLPPARLADTLPILRRLLPADNYTFDREGNCYVAGEPDELDAIQFPGDFSAVWEPIDQDTQLFPLVGGCHFDLKSQAIESVPVVKIIGCLQNLFPQLVFVPGLQGRWHLVGDANSVEAACDAAGHLPDPLPLPPAQPGRLPVVMTACILRSAIQTPETKLGQ